MALARMAGMIASVLLLLVGNSVFAGDSQPKPLKPLDDDNPYEVLLSGKSFLPPEIAAIQDDRFGHPGELAVKRGERLWNEAAGTAEKSCAFCHNKAETSMASVGSRYPAYSKEMKKPISLEQRINLCRRKHMKAPVMGYNSKDLIALTAYVKSFSRGRPVSVKVDGRLNKAFQEGRKAYYRRRGQLNMSCAQCHEYYAGKQFRAMTMSQGQSNAYPAYSVGVDRVVSLHERFQSCNRLVRSEPFGLGSDAYVNLELYLAWRGRGLDVETPGLRY